MNEQVSFPNDDAVKGFRFCATLQLRTPSFVLHHHREWSSGALETLPSYGTQTDGIWLPEFKTWADLAEEAGNIDTALRLRAEAGDDPGTVATDVGRQPNGGQEYCQFLLAFRGVVEGTVPDDEKDRSIQKLVDSEPTYRTFAQKHDPHFAKNWRGLIDRHTHRGINWYAKPANERKAFMEYRVLVVDDQPSMRQALRAILVGHADLAVIGEAADGIEAVDMASELRPDVILMDVQMPRMDGIQATKIIKALQPEITVIGVSGNDSTLLKGKMKEAGAAALIPKGALAERLYEAIATHRPGFRPAS